jgi:hypothetical protein
MMWGSAKPEPMSTENETIGSGPAFKCSPTTTSATRPVAKDQVDTARPAVHSYSDQPAVFQVIHSAPYTPGWWLRVIKAVAGSPRYGRKPALKLFNESTSLVSSVSFSDYCPGE